MVLLYYGSSYLGKKFYAVQRFFGGFSVDSLMDMCNCLVFAWIFGRYLIIDMRF